MDVTQENGVRAEDSRIAGPLGARGISPTRTRPQVAGLNDRLSLRRNFAWTGLANAIYAGCQWAILVALAKAGSAEIVGQFALGLAVTAPVYMFANLQLRSLQATDAKGQYAFADYLGLRLLTTLLAQLVVVAIVVASGYRGAACWVILAVGLTRMLDSLSDVAYGRLQQQERMDRVARSMIVRGVLSLAVVPVVVVASGRLVDGVLAMAGSWAVVLVLYDLPQAARCATVRCATALQKPCGGTSSDTASAKPWHTTHTMPRFHLPTLARVAWLALPLGLITLLGSLSTNIPRYIIESCIGERELGIFAGFVGLFGAVYLVQVAIGQAALPRLAQYHAGGMGKRYVRLSVVLMGTALASGLAGVALAFLGGAPVVRMIYSGEFAEHADLFRWLSIASVGQGVGATLGYLLNAARRFRQSLAVTFTGTLTTGVCSAWLIPRFGLFGGAWAVLGGAGAACLLSAPLLLMVVRSLHSNGKDTACLPARAVIPGPAEAA